jgi:hypothetical protein
MLLHVTCYLVTIIMEILASCQFTKELMCIKVPERNLLLSYMDIGGPIWGRDPLKMLGLYQSFSDVRVQKFRTLKTLRTRTQRVCLSTHLYCKEVNISQHFSEISIFSFLKSYYSLYKPHEQISSIVKTS